MGASGGIESRLWNDSVDGHAYEAGGDKYQAAIMDQYKLYVEMADRISQRRGLTNTFFLTLNTAVVTTLTALQQHPPQGGTGWLALPLAALLGECFAWFSLLRSYRLLNGAKFEVVGALETRLPASPFRRAEWHALGEGRDARRYWPLSHVESWIPLFFASLYLAAFLAAMAGAPSHAGPASSHQAALSSIDRAASGGDRAGSTLDRR